VRRGFVDHTQYDFGLVLHTIEDRWGLPLTAPGAGPFPLARVWPDAGLPAGLDVAGPALLLGGAGLLTAALVAKSRSSVLAATAIAGGTAEYVA